MSRSQKALRNIFFSTGTYLIQLILSLVVRVYFVKYIGTEYLGLNSLYASIMSVISIADLGLDTVFIYLLYRPLKEKNYPEIRGVLRLYKNMYRLIALTITLVGIVLIPFLSDITGGKSNLNGIYTIFILYILNAVVGYLNAYKRSLFIADQDGYVVNGITSGFIVIVDVIQIIQIVVVPSPVLYMCIQVLGTLLTNILINILANKHYPQIFQAKEYTLSKENKRTLIHNGVGGISNKLGSIVVVSSDNILLSIFTNLTLVGMYSNYTVLTTALNKIMQTISVAITPSLGHLGVDGDESKIKQVFLELSFTIYSISLFAFWGFYGFVTPFVVIWLGKNNSFSIFLTWLISVNLWLTLIRVPSWMITDSFGLQWVQKWKAVVEAIINLLVSLMFVSIFKLGIEGIILGTIFSTIAVVLWYEPWVVFRYVVTELTLFKYFRLNIPFLLLMLFGSGIYTLVDIFFSAKDELFSNIGLSVLVSIVLFCLYLIVFKRNHRFIEMTRRMKNLLKQRVGHVKNHAK
ncbi:lipopolysaccharide biosynthesis protein [Lactiplantibacillus plantarum]|uniref:lipopolysaccharide biosynthesis protein n=1 Tax=Lactiplantibacillus plantarum TaxID=1590 RepID=UPI003EB9F3A2